jgi:hypothetical protein
MTIQITLSLKSSPACANSLPESNAQVFRGAMLRAAIEGSDESGATEDEHRQD